MKKDVLETIHLYKKKVKEAYEVHQNNLAKILTEYNDEKDYIKEYVKETDRYIRECNDLKSEFIIDAINDMV